MRKPQAEMEYVSNNSFMTSQVKVPNPFGGDYEDPLEALKAERKTEENPKDENSVAPISDDSILPDIDASNELDKMQNLGVQNINIGRPNDLNLDVLTPKEKVWTPKKETTISDLDAKTPKENNLDAQNSIDSRKWVKYESQRTTDRLSLRPNAETLHKFKVFCAEKKLTLTEFFEIAGQKLIDLDAQIPESLGVLTPYDDRRIDLLYKTNAHIINLFLEYNKIFNEKTDWKPKDDAVGVKYNDVDLRMIEIGIIQTQANILEGESETKVERFKYYTREIDKFAALGYNEQMLDAILEIHRKRWKEITGREIDLKSEK